MRDETGVLVASAMTNECNHCLISGLQPDTSYTYTVRVKHEEWASGLRWDWDPETKGLIQDGSGYTNEFRTLPDPTKPLDGPFTFAVIGDFGTGIRHPSTATRRQREVGLALQRAVDTENVRLILTTGDNIYAAQAVPALDEGFGGRRRRLVLHVLSAVSICDQPRAGVSVDWQSRYPRDGRVRRSRPGDGQLLPGHAAGDRGSGRTRVGRPGALLPVQGRLRRGVRLHRYVERTFLPARPAVQLSEAPGIRAQRVPGAARGADPLADPVLPPPAVLRGAATRQHRRDGRADRALRGGRGPGVLQRPRAQLPALAPQGDRLFHLGRRQQDSIGRAVTHGGGAHGQLVADLPLPAGDHPGRCDDRAGDRRRRQRRAPGDRAVRSAGADR